MTETQRETTPGLPALPVHFRRERFDPVPELARLREQEPVSRTTLLSGPEAWLVTRHQDVREVLSDSERFSIKSGQSPIDSVLLTDDPPEHTRLRKMLAPEFTSRRMDWLRPRVEAIVAEHLDAMEQAGPSVDLVAEFALPIPSLVICELLGVPYADRAEFQERSTRRLDLTLTLPERLAIGDTSRAYTAELVARKRQEPDGALISTLIREHGDELSDDELIDIADLLLIAGHESTSTMLGIGTLVLLLHPEQVELIRSDDARVDQAVEELMRYLTISHSAVPRIALADTEIAGVPIKTGDLVDCSFVGANRDEEVFGAEAGRFDIRRKSGAHIAFGHGIHHCLGAPLARMEMRIAYPALLRRFPGLRLAVPVEEIEFRAHSVVYGVESLPVTW